jgi:hypothetical protein
MGAAEAHEVGALEGVQSRHPTDDDMGPVRASANMLHVQETRPQVVTNSNPKHHVADLPHPFFEENTPKKKTTAPFTPFKVFGHFLHFFEGRRPLQPSY